MSRLLLVSVFTFVVAPAVGDDEFPEIRNTQAAGEHPPSPTEMLDLFELPPGFKVTLFAGEPDVQQPIAFDFDDSGRIWVAENYTYSARGKVDQQMRDRVIILHDKDGDGEHDERKVFWDKGRMMTGLTWGYGGLWILNDGTLSFIPDKNGDDVPDSEPIPMLNGWTKNAGHNVVNGLLWGPDGWLYGRHGITDTSYPGTIDTPKEERAPLNCGIWRFHPVKHTFEIVCHGTTNPWGLDYNEVGDMFMSNNVIGHLWHVIPGAHYQRMFGQDFNPHCYELMGPISDHFHWDESGKWSQSRDGAADDLGGGHSHCGLMLYYGQNFPKEYWGKAFMCNTHGRCVNVDRIERKGSSYVAKHEPNFLKVNTPWFRGVEIKYGPAGCVYLSDWSDNGECHDHDGVHRTSGRIYRISYGEVTKPAEIGLDPNSLEELAGNAIWGDQNGEWHRRKSTRQFVEQFINSRDESEKSKVRIFRENYWSNVPEMRIQSVRLFQVLAAVSALRPGDIRRAIISPNPSVRKLAIEYATDDTTLLAEVEPTLDAWIFNHEESPAVLLTFAGAIQRHRISKLDNGKEFPSPSSLLKLARSGPGDEPLELMTWYAFGAVNSAATTPIIPVTFIENPVIRSYQARWMATDWATHQEKLIELITTWPDPGHQWSQIPDRESGFMATHLMLTAILAGSEGQTVPKIEINWETVKQKYARFDSDEINELIDVLSVQLGSLSSIDRLRMIVRDKELYHSSRIRAINILAGRQDSSSIPILLSLLNDKAVYVDICKALAAFDDDPRIPKELIKRWNSLRHGAKEAAADTLCSRKSYAVEFTKAIADGRVDSSVLTAVQVRQLNAFNDEAITAVVDEHWGVINETPEALEAAIVKWKRELNDDVLSKGDLENGAALFKKTCAACHKLYGEGGKIGPDLTGGNRANMDYVLSNIINPSGEVPKQYTVSIVELKSGRVITGVVVGETAQVINIQTDKELRSIAKSDIEQRTRTSKSLMPNGLLDALNPDEVRDLIAFLRNRQ